MTDRTRAWPDDGKGGYVIRDERQLQAVALRASQPGALYGAQARHMLTVHNVAVRSMVELHGILCAYWKGKKP